MESDRQPVWAAAIAEMAASARRLPAPEPAADLVVGDDPLSSAIADTARMYEGSIAASMSDLRVENETVLAELQRAIRARLEFGE